VSFHKGFWERKEKDELVGSLGCPKGILKCEVEGMTLMSLVHPDLNENCDIIGMPCLNTEIFNINEDNIIRSFYLKTPVEALQLPEEVDDRATKSELSKFTNGKQRKLNTSVTENKP
jgi:hypothetical protein